MSNIFGKHLGIDIGTTTTRVYVKGEGVVLEEPTYVLLDKNTKEILAIGEEAKKAEGRESEGIEVVRPMHGRKINNLYCLQAFLKEIIYLSVGSSFFRPKSLLAITPETTPVQRKVLEETLIEAGVSSVSIESVPILAALGNDIPFEKTTGRTIVVIGAQLMNVSILSSGGVVSTYTDDIGGNTLNAAIKKSITEKHGINIGNQTVEHIKRTIGSAVYLENDQTIDIEVMAEDTKISDTIQIYANEMTEAMLPTLETMADKISTSIHNIPPQITGDIVENGILLCGGTTNLHYIQNFFEHMLGVSITMSKNPETCIVHGTGAMFNGIQEEKNIHTVKQ